MKARKKPVDVEAEQWVPGKVVDGVIISPEEILYSAGGTHYYISRPGCLAQHWLSVERFQGEVPEEKKRDSFKGYVQISPRTGGVYYREMLSFMMFDFSGRTIHKFADKTTELYKDYIASMGWTEDYTPIAYIQTPEGRMEVSFGDWIITELNGERSLCKPDIFAKTYETVEECAGVY